MSWSYDSTLPTDKDKVRFRIGDTNTNAQLLANEEISATLTLVGSGGVVMAAIFCIKAIIAKLARDYDRSNVGMSAQRSQQIQHYRDLLADLQAGGIGGLASATMSVGGLSKDTEEGYDEDSDYKSPDLRRGMDDYVNPKPGKAG